MALTGQICCPL